MQRTAEKPSQGISGRQPKSFEQRGGRRGTRQPSDAARPHGALLVVVKASASKAVAGDDSLPQRHSRSRRLPPGESAVAGTRL